MKRRSRANAAAPWIAAIAGGLLLLATPDTASADREHRSHFRHHRHQARAHRHHHLHEHGWAIQVDRYRIPPATWKGHRHGFRAVRRAARHAFYCDLCRHGYASRAHFHDHLHGHHRIPVWRIPHVVLQTSFGWVFSG
jgi:hypothetical protein